MSQVISKVEALAAPIVKELHMELVDVEFIKEGTHWFLRVYIDKEGGVDIDDCSRVSEKLSVKLDETDPIPQAYFLEVSSPGAERPLKKEEDLRKAVGKHVHITTYQPINNEKVFEGELLSFENGELVIAEAKGKRTLAYSQVESARLAIVM